MRRFLLLAALAGVAAPAQAGPMTTGEARKALFNATRYKVAAEPRSGLSQAQLDFITGNFFTQLKRAAGFTPVYYGSVAVSPAFFGKLAENPQTAALSGLMQLVVDFHSPAGADAAALRACEQARQAGQGACVVAARVLPRRWKPRSLMLSSTATAAFRNYRRAKAPKAFAISPSTGGFAFATGAGAGPQALAQCRARSGAGDCEIVIAD